MRKLFVTTQVGVLLCSLYAHAASSADDFQSLYEDASTKYLAGRYSEAVTAYQAAYKLKQLPKLLLMIGKSQMKLGAVSDAKQSFQWFLAIRPDGADSDDARQLLAQCQKLLLPPKLDDAVSSSPPPPSEKAAPVNPQSSEPSESVAEQRSEPPGTARPADRSTANAEAETKVGDQAEKTGRPATMGPGSWSAVALSAGLGAVAGALGIAAELKARRGQETVYQIDGAEQALRDASLVRQLSTSAVILGSVSAVALVSTFIAIGVRSRRDSTIPVVIPSADSKTLSLTLWARF